jgi:hypothetical protein
MARLEYLAGRLPPKPGPARLRTAGRSLPACAHCHQQPRLPGVCDLLCANCFADRCR